VLRPGVLNALAKIQFSSVLGVTKPDNDCSVVHAANGEAPYDPCGDKNAVSSFWRHILLSV